MTNAVKQFVTAAEESKDEESLELDHGFTLGGVDYFARLPTKAEVALWMVATGNGNRAGYDETIRFLMAVLHDGTWDDDEGNLLRDKDGRRDEDIPEGFDPDEQMTGIYTRWRNPKDPLDVDDFLPVVRWLIEEKATFPTTSSSGSSSGQQKRGQSSTRATRPKASTRARSTSAASAG